MNSVKLMKKIKKKNADYIRKSLRREKELRKLECWMQNSSFNMLNFISVPREESVR